MYQDTQEVVSDCYGPKKMNERCTADPSPHFFSQVPAACETTAHVVLAAMADTRGPRLDAIMTSAVRHLHAFLIESRPSEAEFEHALQWINDIGRATNEFHNEAVLAADILGASTLIDLINNDGMQGETLSALLLRSA